MYTIYSIIILIVAVNGAFIDKANSIASENVGLMNFIKSTSAELVKEQWETFKVSAFIYNFFFFFALSSCTQF